MFGWKFKNETSELILLGIKFHISCLVGSLGTQLSQKWFVCFCADRSPYSHGDVHCTV